MNCSIVLQIPSESTLLQPQKPDSSRIKLICMWVSLRSNVAQLMSKWGALEWVFDAVHIIRQACRRIEFGINLAIRWEVGGVL